METKVLGAFAEYILLPQHIVQQNLFLKPYGMRYENATQAELARLFGNEFADVIVKQPTGRWVGPIASGYGAHLVRVESVTTGGTPALEEVRPALEREWANAKRKQLSQAFCAKLRAKYAIKVKMPEAAKP